MYNKNAEIPMDVGIISNLNESFFLQFLLNSLINEAISVVYPAKWLNQSTTKLNVNPFHSGRRSAYRSFLLLHITLPHKHLHVRHIR